MFIEMEVSSKTKTKAANVLLRRWIEGTYYEPSISLVMKGLQGDAEMVHNAIIRHIRKMAKKER